MRLPEIVRAGDTLAAGAKLQLSWGEFTTAGELAIRHHVGRAEGWISLRWAIAGEPRAVHVELLGLPTPWGRGHDWRFRCPGCRRTRRRIVWSGDCRRVGCRACLGLTYASQRRAKSDRPWAAAHRIRDALGVEGGALEPLMPWHRPKGMHHKTWARIVAADARSQARLLAAFFRAMGPG